MLLNNQVVPAREEFIKFMKTYPKDEPVVMINLLKFKEKSGQGDESGREAYMRYSKNVQPLLDRVGGKVLWSGEVNMTIIGDPTDHPEMVAIVEYPSAQKFIEMATSAAYREVGVDREISLQYGGLLASSTRYLASS